MARVKPESFATFYIAGGSKYVRNSYVTMGIKIEFSRWYRQSMLRKSSSTNKTTRKSSERVV